ncbi:MAG: hypothetical protein A2158_00915 [Chloroflexi bacterium RBG_13_46_14]|nr:MAG: hypothetical protein A2158_00915 [Chloroflexi bacterium RBG_13_46_14]
MGRVPITLMGFRCERCSHEWFPKKENKEPRVCPRCKSPYWNVPKTKSPMSYQEFANTIKSVLDKEGNPMTWTEIRTKAHLPQKWPNNKWVYRMEDNIGLVREKDHNGIIRWRIQ